MYLITQYQLYYYYFYKTSLGECTVVKQRFSNAYAKKIIRLVKDGRIEIYNHILSIMRDQNRGVRGKGR